MARVATYKEKAEELKKKIKKALSYPIAVLVIACICTGVLLVKVVPQFAETFGSFGAELPAFTLWVLSISEAMQATWYLYIAAVIGLGFVHKQLARRSKKYAELIDIGLLKTPVIGDIMYNGCYRPVCQDTGHHLRRRCCPLLKALDSVAGAAGNLIYEAGIKKIQQDVVGGTPLNVAMRSSGLFPPLALQMTTHW